jgi:hypothetical protein
MKTPRNMTYIQAEQNDYARRLKTGEFYTPPYLAQESAGWLMECLTLDPKAYVFYDPAAGAGNLLEALPEGVERWGSTLEYEDIPILKSKGINAFQFDFLEGKISEFPEQIMRASNEGRLVVFTNPPYFKVPADKYQSRKKQYGGNDSCALFLQIIIEELQPICTGFWSKIDVYSSLQVFKQMHSTYMQKQLRHLRYPIMCNSKRFACKGEYPIVFSVWSEWEDSSVVDSLYLSLHARHRERYESPYFRRFRDTMPESAMLDYVNMPMLFDIYPKDCPARPISEAGYHYQTHSWERDLWKHFGLKFVDTYNPHGIDKKPQHSLTLFD